MIPASDLASLAGLLANETRAAMCLALLDGRAWTARELATHANVAPSTATEHLHRLVEGGLLVERRQGRHRYVQLADPSVATLLEDLSARLAPAEAGVRGLRASTAHQALRRGRTCYDHLAGRLGIAVTDAMAESGLLDVTGGFALTAAGRQWLTGPLGVDPAGLRPRPAAARAGLPGLDGAPPAPGRRRRRQAVRAVLRQRLGDPGRVGPGRPDDAGGQDGAAGSAGDHRDRRLRLGAGRSHRRSARYHPAVAQRANRRRARAPAITGPAARERLTSGSARFGLRTGLISAVAGTWTTCAQPVTRRSPPRGEGRSGARLPRLAGVTAFTPRGRALRCRREGLSG